MVLLYTMINYIFKEQIEKLECNIYLVNLHVRSFTKEKIQMQLSVQFQIFFRTSNSP